jgi:hypothetical protein
VSKTKWDGVAGEPSIRVQVERSVNHLLQRLNRRIQVPRSETQMILAWKTISFHKKRSTFHRKSKEFVENQCEITIFRWFELFFLGKIWSIYVSHGTWEFLWYIFCDEEEQKLISKNTFFSRAPKVGHKK